MSPIEGVSANDEARYTTTTGLGARMWNDNVKWSGKDISRPRKQVHLRHPLTIARLGQHNLYQTPGDATMDPTILMAGEDNSPDCQAF